MNFVEISTFFLRDIPCNFRRIIIHGYNNQVCDMNDLFLSLHDDVFNLCCDKAYRSDGVLNAKIYFGFFSYHIKDDETMRRVFPGCNALSRNDSAGNHLVLESDLILYFSFYPCFCSSFFSNLDDNMAAIYDLYSCYDVAIVNTYHDNLQLYLSNLHKEQEEEATLASFCYLTMFIGEFGVALIFN